MIYEWFAIQGSAGSTCERAAHELGVRYTTCSGRISELKADGWIVATGARSKTSGGSSCAVLRAVSKAERERNRSPQLAWDFVRSA